MTHLLDTHVWVDQIIGEPLPILVERTLFEYRDTLAISGISLWEVAQLVDRGLLEMDISLHEFFLKA